MYRILEYPPNATKNKITIYPDDVNRLNEDEFLNDTIIEFYLTYAAL
jgi:Ulp1 family protease